MRRDAVAVGTGRLPAPSPHLGPGLRVKVQPTGGCADDVGEPLVRDPLVNQSEACSLGQRVVLESGQETGGQRADVRRRRGAYAGAAPP